MKNITMLPFSAACSRKALYEARGNPPLFLAFDPEVKVIRTQKVCYYFLCMIQYPGSWLTFIGSLMRSEFPEESLLGLALIG